MKKLLSGLLLLSVLISCKKDDASPSPITKPHPKMQYTDLHDAEVRFGGSKNIDINNDGTMDFRFATLLVGDPSLGRDRQQFYLYSKIGTYLLHDTDDQTPVLKFDDSIAVQQPGHQWFEVGAIVLAERITPLRDPIYWQGTWRREDHKYMAVQIKKNDEFYNGWIEASFDQISQKLILHKAAICLEAGKTIRAGN